MREPFSLSQNAGGGRGIVYDRLVFIYVDQSFEI